MEMGIISTNAMRGLNSEMCRSDMPPPKESASNQLTRLVTNTVTRLMTSARSSASPALR